jgi:hypothetical protein
LTVKDGEVTVGVRLSFLYSFNYALVGVMLVSNFPKLLRGISVTVSNDTPVYCLLVVTAVNVVLPLVTSNVEELYSFPPFFSVQASDPEVVGVFSWL